MHLRFCSISISIIVTDETYIDPNSQPDKLLTDLTVRSVQEASDRGLTTGIHRTKGRGNRLLILHMLGPDGLIPECERIWIRSDKTIQTEDYHHVRSEMNKVFTTPNYFHEHTAFLGHRRTNFL